MRVIFRLSFLCLKFHRNLRKRYCMDEASKFGEFICFTYWNLLITGYPNNLLRLLCPIFWQPFWKQLYALRTPYWYKKIWNYSQLWYQQANQNLCLATRLIVVYSVNDFKTHLFPLESHCTYFIHHSVIVLPSNCKCKGNISRA